MLYLNSPLKMCFSVEILKYLSRSGMTANTKNEYYETVFIGNYTKLSVKDCDLVSCLSCTRLHVWPSPFLELQTISWKLWEELKRYSVKTRSRELSSNIISEVSQEWNWIRAYLIPKLRRSHRELVSPKQVFNSSIPNPCWKVLVLGITIDGSYTWAALVVKPSWCGDKFSLER